MRLLPLSAFLAFVWFLACGGKVPTEGEPSDAATHDTTTTPGTCSWSSTFEPSDAETKRDNCRAARMLVSCTGTDGSGSLCMNNEEKCALPDRPGVSYTCLSQCKSTEFAAKCGDLMGSSVQPPADCHIAVTPPGGPFYCCSCSM
jgi:hypothetical protein